MKVKVLTIWVLVTFVAAGPGTALGQDVEAIQLPESKEEAYYTFEETTGRVSVYVSGQLAALEQVRSYVPFQVAVSVTGKGPELSVTRLNFELHDAYGSVHESARSEDVQKDGINSFVKDWVRTNPLQTGNDLANYRRIASDLYPTTQGGITEAHLDRETYLVDVVYFPAPKDLHGELMLSFWAKGMEAGAVNVRFKVPEMKQKKSRRKK